VTTVDETHDPKLSSWVESARGHATFPIQNLPFGIFSTSEREPRPGMAIGDAILDLRAVAEHLPEGVCTALGASTLNELFALDPRERLELRRRVSKLLSDGTYTSQVQPHLYPAAACTMHVPSAIGGYTDFYSGIHHAVNVGKQFRPDQPLLPNYKYVPIGYHGRTSSVRPSGEPVRRPKGQRKSSDLPDPQFELSRRLDYELELAVWIGRGNPLGEPIPVAQAIDHIAGLGLLNDWSARDVQAWEYQPLGPFLSKSFCTTVSPWVISIEALAPFRVAQQPRPDGDPTPLPYLWSDADQTHGAFEIELSVHLCTSQMRAEGLVPQRVAQTSSRYMYWTIAQLLAHHTSNGCNLQAGDLFGSGTLSAPTPDGCGSLLETTRGGAEPLVLSNGEQRTFLEDGDEVILSATAKADGFVSIGFGACTGRVTSGAV